jgi:hypothetical protein
LFWRVKEELRALSLDKEILVGVTTTIVADEFAIFVRQ